MKLKNYNFFLTSAKMLLLTSALSFSIMSCSDDDDDNDNTPSQTVLDIAVANENFDVLAAAAAKADLESTLDGNGPITVFAPTDAAFVSYLGVANEAAAITAVNGLTAAAAADLLTFHVISGSEIKAADIANGTTAVTTARGTNNKAFVTKAASGVTINNARVTTPDVDASNGVIHIIDAVLTPPTGNAVTIAVADDRFDILAAAVAKADLATTLQGNGPFTIFAPTDVAFIDLLKTASFSNNPGLTEQGAIDYVNGLSGEGLAGFKEVLLYHVVSGAVYSINLSNGSVPTLKTNAPKNLTIGGAGSSTITVTGSAAGSTASNVAVANVSATNGVIHGIDKVLLP